MKSKLFFNAINILTIFVFLIGTVGMEPVQAANHPPVRQSLAKTTINASATPAPDQLRYGYNSNTGKLSFVGGDVSAPLQAAAAGGISAQGVKSAGAVVLAKYANDFGLKDPSKELKLERTEPSSSGDTLRYQQQYNGIPVLGGELLVNSDAKGNILSLNGKVSPDLSLSSTTPAGLSGCGSPRRLAMGRLPKGYCRRHRRTRGPRTSRRPAARSGASDPPSARSGARRTGARRRRPARCR